MYSRCDKMTFKTFISDYKWWYKKQAPKYGYFRSIFDCWFNARIFNRDGTYRVPTGNKK